MSDPQTPAEPADCSELAAQRAGADHTSLKDTPEPTEADPEHSETSEADLDEALEDSMDGSDPPSVLQP